ncbi:isoleucine-tRNA ligase [Elasticomyces elasticus]|nr:isoleucine-tRNA ligase [Elasticomyces elasticus]
MPSATRILRAAAAATGPAQNWSKTLHLPSTTFPARASPSELSQYRKQVGQDLYSWQAKARPAVTEDGEQNIFVLHDGPPYANGSLHIGHALNKVLKDMILRWEVGQGKRVHFRPGWDCHGLPIELKALQLHMELALAKKKDGRPPGEKTEDLDPIGIRKAARELAERAIEEQKVTFKSWGIMGDWEKPYKTMDAEFEGKQLEVFAKMVDKADVQKGMIYRRKKPVYWSPSSQTALAEAELEYDDNHKVTAAFVRFPLTRLSGALSSRSDISQLSAAIWTTTPWTLPANKAIAVRSDLDYTVIDVAGAERNFGQLIVAKERLEHLLSHLPSGSTTKTVIESIPGSQLVDSEYTNTLSGQEGKTIHADFVTSTSGTGLVHLAPGHGMEDYGVCMKLGIGTDAFAPVDDQGCFTEEALPSNPGLLQGLPVETTGAKAVLDLLEGSSLVLATHDLTHKNPVDWRTKLPVITRATEQWFADVEDMKSDALASLEDVEFIPESSKNRLESFINGRSQWCISRQRSWGVPIPALYNKSGEAVMDSKTLSKTLQMIKKRGTDAWWTDPQDGDLVRGKDTMDVWFDSGTTWTSLMTRLNDSPADLYVEGTDQHRGWFQSSLLTHVAARIAEDGVVCAPYKTLLTHGFVLDQDGRKMSKSLGNVIAPEQITDGTLLPPVKMRNVKGVKDNKPHYDAMGPDALRLWVASSDYTKDVVVGQPVLHSVHTTLQKYRVTMKWLLGVLNDYPTAGPAEELLGELFFADQITLHQLAKTARTVYTAYENYEFFKGVNAINKFINHDLSAFYFEVVKDRLYADEQQIRAHTQTVLFLVLEQLIHMLTPITPLLVQEVWEHMPADLRGEREPLLQRLWEGPFEAAFDSLNEEELDDQIAALGKVSDAVKAAQEEARRAGKIGSGLACRVELHLPKDTNYATTRVLTDLEESDELSELLVVSDAKIVLSDLPPEERYDEEEEEEEDEDGNPIERKPRPPPAWSFEVSFDVGDDESSATGKAVVLPPLDEKCIRCWQYLADEKDTLCGRCEFVLKADSEAKAEEQRQGEEEVREEEDEEDEGDEEDEEDDGPPSAGGRRRPVHKRRSGY